MNLEKNLALRVDPIVYKFLAKIPRKDSERILFELENLAKNPFTGDVQKMKGEDSVWRRRVGAYRFFYEISKTQKIVHVFKLERRTTATY
ncbi:MAG: type II toxin-antitoxin system RelE/ParE family toxin [Candidatus Taylorbacteria bacterium]|nr:type II toxin-antitoxin system RelE/ParE family toxin [Candidatus Taylorbacteria bacterium]